MLHNLECAPCVCWCVTHPFLIHWACCVYNCTPGANADYTILCICWRLIAVAINRVVATECLRLGSGSSCKLLFVNWLCFLHSRLYASPPKLSTYIILPETELDGQRMSLSFSLSLNHTQTYREQTQRHTLRDSRSQQQSKTNSKIY